jgi:hypothetical protein
MTRGVGSTSVPKSHDPHTVFKNLPAPHKATRNRQRLARDVAGRAESGQENISPTQGGDG